MMSGDDLAVLETIRETSLIAFLPDGVTGLGEELLEDEFQPPYPSRMIALRKASHGIRGGVACHRLGSFPPEERVG